jgi:hypothetical protein
VNKNAFELLSNTEAKMLGITSLEIQLFEEPGKKEEVAQIAAV